MSQPGEIDGLPFARSGLELAGTLSPAHLSRLAETVAGVGPVAYEVHGGFSERGKPCLRIRASAELELTCQRCLESLPYPVQVDSELELSESEQEMALAEDDIDRVLATQTMDVAHLVEDEILLALPDAPRHADCAPPAGGEGVKQASPFDVLANLKRKQ